MNFRLVGFVLVVLMLMSGSVLASQFASHRATYDLELRQSGNGSALKSIDGRSVFSLERHCDGWQLVEDNAIRFSFEDGSLSFISHHESWESFSSKAFSFSAVKNSDARGPSAYSGFANLADGGGGRGEFGGEAHFLADARTAARLPDGTQFPMHHLRRMLAVAEQGQNFHGGLIFIGGEHDRALFYVSSVIGKPKAVAGDALLGELGTDSYRYLRMAYYKPDAMELEPDYEIELLLQQNGVTRQYVVDYGDYTMRANLLDITALDEPSC